MGAALAGLAVQTLVDTYPATPNMLIMLALVAFIVSDLNISPSGVRGPYTVYLALALLAIYAAGFVWITRADFRFQRSFQAEQASNLSEAVAEASSSQALDPDLALRTFRLALLEARLAAQTESPDALGTAIEQYRAGLQQEPILGTNSANLAGLLWQQGQSDEAIATLQRTVAVKNDPLYWVNLGYFWEQSGDWDAASLAYGRALLRSPGLADSGFWQASPERVARWPDFVDAAVSLLEDKSQSEKVLRLNFALTQDDLEVVENLIGPVAADTEKQYQAELTELYFRQGQPEQLEALLAPNPDSAQDYFWWGWLKLQQADKVAAEKLLKTAIFLGNQRAYYYLGQLYEQQGDLAAAEEAYRRGFSPHTVAEDIAVTIYGRPGGLDLAPQLLRMGVGPRQAQSWLALARLYETQQRYDEAKRIYTILLIEDPFLSVARERLDLLNGVNGG